MGGYRPPPPAASTAISTGSSVAAVVIEGSALYLFHRFSPSVDGHQPTMASADFCNPIPIPLDTGSQWQDNRPPRVRRVTFAPMPAASTSAACVQVSGFEDMRLITHRDRLICDSWGTPSLRRASVLPAAPFRSHLTVNTLAVRLIVPLVGPIGDLHPQVIRPPPRVVGTAPVKALRAMPGAHKKKDYRNPVILSLFRRAPRFTRTFRTPCANPPSGGYSTSGT